MQELLFLLRQVHIAKKLDMLQGCYSLHKPQILHIPFWIKFHTYAFSDLDVVDLFQEIPMSYELP